MTHTEYQTALQKIATAPLTLTEYDFAVLAEFNPADEQRGRDAVRREQIARVTKAQTKATAPTPDEVGIREVMEAVMEAVLRPLLARVRALETRSGVVDPRALHTRATAAIVDLQRANFVTAIRTAGHDVPDEFIATADRLVELAAMPAESTRLM